MIIKKFLTRKGWRVVAHSMLAAAGIGLLYLLSKMVIGDIQQEDTVSWWILGLAITSFIGDIQQEDTVSWWILGLAITSSLWLVALGSMLAKAELTDWR